jgi:hypothetical protein
MLEDPYSCPVAGVLGSDKPGCAALVSWHPSITAHAGLGSGNGKVPESK